MTEDDGLIIDLRRMFPEAVKRVEILERLKRAWPSVVRFPAVWRYSLPVVLGVNYVVVDVRNDTAKKMLSNMAGNIMRALSAMGYESDGDFSLRFHAVKKENLMGRKKSSVREILADGERVRQYMNGAPETLPEEINYALAHLRAYLDGRQKSARV